MGMLMVMVTIMMERWSFEDGYGWGTREGGGALPAITGGHRMSGVDVDADGQRVFLSRYACLPISWSELCI